MKENFLKGIFKENPILVSMLGFCPTLAITTKLENAIGMGLAVIFVLVMSNFIVSLVRHITPDEIRIPVFIVIIASFVTIVEMVMEAFLPGLHSSLGVFIPLIVVNCIILGRAEAFASKNNPLSSIVDGLGIGIGCTLVLSLFAIVREVLGAGTITVWKDLVIDINSLFGQEKLAIFSDFFVSSPGAFIIIGFIFAIVAAIQNRKAKKAGETK